MAFPLTWRRTLDIIKKKCDNLQHDLYMRNRTIEHQIEIISELKGENARQRKELEHLRKETS